MSVRMLVILGLLGVSWVLVALLSYWVFIDPPVCKEQLDLQFIDKTGTPRLYLQVRRGQTVVIHNKETQPIQVVFDYGTFEGVTSPVEIPGEDKEELVVSKSADDGAVFTVYFPEPELGSAELIVEGGP